MVERVFKAAPETRSRAKARGTARQVVVRPAAYAEVERAEMSVLKQAMVIPPLSPNASIELAIAHNLSQMDWMPLSE